MEYIEKALNLLAQINHTNSSELVDAAEAILPKASKEFEALKAAGIEVKIEQVETVTVVKPKSKRGGYRPRTKKSKQEEN